MLKSRLHIRIYKSQPPARCWWFTSKVLLGSVWSAYSKQVKGLHAFLWKTIECHRVMVNHRIWSTAWPLTTFISRILLIGQNLNGYLSFKKLLFFLTFVVTEVIVAVFIVLPAVIVFRCEWILKDHNYGVKYWCRLIALTVLRPQDTDPVSPLQGEIWGHSSVSSFRGACVSVCVCLCARGHTCVHVWKTF